MKKIVSSKIFWMVSIILVIGGGAFGQFLISNKKIEYITEKVVRGNVIQTVAATGQVKSASDIKLNFKITGELNSLNYQVGDQVAAGNILATLKSTSLQIDVNRARASLQEAQANLQKIIAGSTAEEIAIAQAEFDKSQASLTSAQSDLAAADLIYGQALENAKQNLLTDIKIALSKVEISLQKVNDTLNFENNPNAFVTSNLSLKQAVAKEYSDVLAVIASANSSYDMAVINKTDQNLDLAFDKTITALLSTQSVLSNLRTLLNYVITNSALTQDDLTTLKSSINTELTTTNASISTLQESSQDLVDAKINFDTKTTQAANAVLSAEKAVAKAQADLELKTAAARSEDVSLARASVAKAQADLDSTQEKILDASIIAPQSGIITKINYEVGEQTSLTTPVIEMLADSGFKIEVDIPESDIAKVSVGDFVQVTLDAFDDNDIFRAQIISIDPAETRIQDVVYFRITAILDDHQDESVANLVPKIKPGMTANIEIKTAEATDVLIIPFRAVKEVDGQRYVEILADNQALRIAVTLGLRGENGEVEVLTGLSEGQLVITSVK